MEINVLVLMDYSTKWPEAFALRNFTTERVLKCLLDDTTRTGVPRELLTDNGSNFISKSIKQYCNRTGIIQIRTSLYQPQDYLKHLGIVFDKPINKKDVRSFRRGVWVLLEIHQTFFYCS